MSESIQQAITAARSLSPEVRAVLSIEGDAPTRDLLKDVAAVVDEVVRRHGMTPAFWLDYGRIGTATIEAPTDPLPEKCWKPAPARREKNEVAEASPLLLEARDLLTQLKAIELKCSDEKVRPLGMVRIAAMLNERGVKVSDCTLSNILTEKFPVAPKTLTPVAPALRALLTELTTKPEPPAPDDGGREWVSGFEPLESTKPEREKVSDEVRALQALASGCMWPNVLAARFGWSEGYTRQLVDRLSGQGRVKRDDKGRFYITHLGRKATLEAAA